MMKRTFFTVLLCFLLSFSIFVVDVYAASSSVSYYLYPVSSLSIIPSGTYKGWRSASVNPVVHFYEHDFLGNKTGLYAYSITYTIVDYVSIVPYKNRTGSSPDYSYSGLIQPGTYSFLAPLSYTIKLYDHVGSSLYPPYYSYSISPRLDNLPPGLTATASIHDDNFKDDFSYNFQFWLTGSCYFSEIGYSPTFPLVFDITLSGTQKPLSEIPLMGSLNFACKFEPIFGFDDRFSKINFTHVSNYDTTDSILGGIDDTINQQHQEEIDKADQATSDVTGGVGQLTGTLSSWEIITMPFNLVKNFAQAIAGDGSSALTFPSFSMMGYQIWPSYTFDLQTVASNFPVLYNGLHLVSGTVVVTGFVRYLWRKWSLLVGDDMPEGSDTS